MPPEEPPLEIEIGEDYIKDAFDFLEIKYTITNREIGDIRCGDTVIERKTYDDFCSSMRIGHLENQYIDMAHYPYKFILISGELSRENELHRPAIDGMFARLARQGITIITVRDDWNLVLLALNIIKKARKFPGGNRIVKRSKNPAIDILNGAAPRITTKLRTALLEKYGSSLNIALASIDELKEMPDCGITLATRIHENFRKNEFGELHD